MARSTGRVDQKPLKAAVQTYGFAAAAPAASQADQQAANLASGEPPAGLAPGFQYVMQLQHGAAVPMGLPQPMQAVAQLDAAVEGRTTAAPG